MRWLGLVAIFCAFGLLAGCAADEPAPADRDDGELGTLTQRLTNGGFESGNLSGWTVQTYLNQAIATFPPTTIAHLNLRPGGFDRTNAVGPAATPLSLVPGGLNQTASLRYPFEGQWAAAVNLNQASRNANKLSRTFTVTAADVDPADGKIHVRMTLAPIVQSPGHPPREQPYFFVEVTNVTKGIQLYHSFNFANEPGVPWKNHSASVLYTDWRLIDVAPGSASLSIGDEVQVEIVAAGCSQSGHWGHVYVDGFGSFIPTLSVAASAPQSVNRGENLTYVHRVSNTSAAEAENLALRIQLPVDTTFVSLGTLPTGMSCTPPAVGTRGVVNCTLDSLNANATVDVPVTVLVRSTLALPAEIAHGDYAVSADAFPSLIGHLVKTTVTSNVAYADLATSLTSSVAAAGWGQGITYTLEVENRGPNDVVGASVTAPLPPEIAAASWTCDAPNGACAAASGAGGISTTVDLPMGAKATFVIDATFQAGSGAGTAVYTATASLPAGLQDSDPSNDAAASVVSLGNVHSLTVTKDLAIAGRVVSSPVGIDCAAGCDTDTGDFLDGSLVSLTAIAPAGTVFAGWTGGACTGTTNPCAFNISGDTTIEAHFEYVISASAPGGNGSITCESPVAPGGSSTCTITRDYGYLLASLSDDGADVFRNGLRYGGTYVIDDVQGPHVVRATFGPARLFRVTKQGEFDARITSPALGMDCGPRCVGWGLELAEGTEVELTLTVGPGVIFDSWDGVACSGPNCTFTINGNTTANANFRFLISASAPGGGGSIQCTSPLGAKVTSTCDIEEDQGYRLVSLQDNGVEVIHQVSRDPATGRIVYWISNLKGPHDVEATFERLRTVTVSKDAGIDGTVTSQPSRIACGQGCSEQEGDFLDGAQVELTATAGPGVVFTGWWGACNGTANPCVFTAGQDVSVRANFAYEVSGTSTAGGRIACQSPISPGGTAVCTVAPDVGFALISLTDNGAEVLSSVTAGNYVLRNVNAPHGIHATFEALRNLTITKEARIGGVVTSSPGSLSCGGGCQSQTEGFVGGTAVSLTATAPAGVGFIGWTWDCAGQGNPCVVTMATDATAGAIFGYEVTTVATYGGAISCESPVRPGGSSTCTITPNPGHALVGLADNGVDVFGAVAGGVYTIANVQGPHALQPSFSRLRNVTLSKVGTIDGTVTSTPAGISCGSGCSGQGVSVVDGTQVELVATAGPGVVFTHWQGGVCDRQNGPCVFVADRDVQVEAVFAYEFIGTIAGGQGSISCLSPVAHGGSGSCGIQVDPNFRLVSALDNGVDVTNQLTSSSGGAWAYDVANVQEPHTFQVVLEQVYLVQVSKDAGIDGAVISDPAGIACGSGCASASERFPGHGSIELTATAGPGVEFMGWSGDVCTGAANPCVFAAGQSVEVHANFGYVVTASAPGGNGSIVCDAAVARGGSATCTIAPAPGFGLSALTDNGVDVFGAAAGGTYTISNVQEAHAIEASFAPLRTVTVSKDEAIDGTVTSQPAGISCGAGCSGQAAALVDGTQVELTATPGPGVAFLGWSGDVCEGSTAPCAFMRNQDVHVQANFGYRITGSFTNGRSGLHVIYCSDPVAPGGWGQCQFIVTPDYRVVSFLDNGVEAVDRIEQFDSDVWFYDFDDVQEPHTVEVVLERMHAIEVGKHANIDGTVTSDPAGISCGLGCSRNSARFPDNTRVELTATPGPGVVFTGWTGACVSAHPVCPLFASQLQMVHAHFSYVVSGTASAGGSISCQSPAAPGAATFCTIAAEPGHVLVGLTDNGADVVAQVSGGVYALSNVQGPHEIHATFSPLRSLTVTKVAGIESSVAVTPGSLSCGLGCGSLSHSFVDGTVVSLAASSAPNMVFVGWTGACAGEGNPCDVALQADATVGAIFAYPIDVASTAGGLVDCPAHVEPGATAVCTLTPDAGYVLDAVTDNGQPVILVDGQYFIWNASGPHALDVVFKQDRGTVCTADADCGSGLCVDGVCCDAACDGQCEACDVAGSEGTCSPVAGAPRGDRDACASDGSLCGGTCDGAMRDSCAYPTTECTAASCTDGVATLAASCSGDGSCPAVVQVDCAPYACGAEACLEACTSDADCVAGFTCDLYGAVCVPNVSISVSGPPAANEGMEITYTYVVENRAPTSSDQLVITLEIPEATSFVSLDAPGFDCAGPAAGVITCAHDGLPGASYETITLTVVIDEPAAVTQIENDGFSVREGGYDAQSGNPLVTQVTTGALYADLRVSVTSDAAQAAWDSPAFFTVVVENDGPHDVVGARVQALLPALADAATWTCASQVGSCRTASGVDGIDTRVDLSAGATATFVVRVWSMKGFGSDTLTYTARAFAPNGVTDGYPANDTGSASVGLISGHQLLVEKDPIGGLFVEPEHLECGVGCTEASGAFLDGTVVTVVAEAPTGVVFTGWEGACSGTVPSCTFPVNGPVELVAHFAFEITTTTTAGGAIDCPANVEQGGSATCELHPGAGYVAHALTDNGQSAATSGGSYTITDAQGPHEISVVFKQDRGTSCTEDAVCGTGLCVDGFCCDGACDGQCEACDVLGSEGTCSPVTGAPHGDRAACAADGSSCGGVCDGADPFACAYPGGETACRPASCTDGIATVPASCAGTGSCPAVVTVSCGLYACGADSCLTSCGGDFDCAAGNYCLGGACVPKETLGFECQADNECASGLCVDGFCCDGACDGQCEACDVEGSEGSCTPVLGEPHGDRDACDSDGSACGGYCDGVLADACTYPDASTLCRAPSCADGVAVLPGFCDGTGACPEIEEQDCAPYVCGEEACLGDCDNDVDCAEGQYCSAGVCVDEKENGTICSADNQCASGLCVDGVCCNAACDGQCEACDVAGNEGTCVPVQGAPHGGREACASDGSVCGGTCDGVARDACSFPAEETRCGEATCEEGVATPEAVCQGDGSCQEIEEVSCGHYACGEEACLDSCTTDAECADAAYCLAGTCRPRGDYAEWQALGSGGCSTSGGGSGLGLALLVVGFALVAGRRKAASLGALALCLGAGSAGAQVGLDRSFQANRFQPSGGAHDLLGVSSARVAPNGQFRASFFLNYAHEPLRIVSRSDDALGETLLRYQTTADFMASIGLFDWFELSAVLPVALAQGANQPPLLPTDLSSGPSGGAADLRLIPKALLYDGAVRLGVAVPVTFPIAMEDAYLGHGAPTVGVRGLVEWEQPGALLLSGYVGNTVAGEREFVGLHAGSAFQYGVAAAHPFALSSERFQAILTATGERVWAKGDEPSPLELTGAVKWFAPMGLDVTVGGGPGLSDGYGTPSYRLLAGVGYTPAAKAERACAPCEPAPLPPPPPADRDGDGIPDQVDACPDEPGVLHRDSERNGCPHVQVTATAFLVPEPIRFDINSATILPESEEILGELAALLKKHVEVQRLSIEGHTDSIGGAEPNLRLSERRAAAVMQWLINNGVEASRLSSVGHGLTRPVADNATPEGREKNRRVEFRILERAVP